MGIICSPVLNVTENMFLIYVDDRAEYVGANLEHQPLMSVNFDYIKSKVVYALYSLINVIELGSKIEETIWVILNMLNVTGAVAAEVYIV